MQPSAGVILAYLFRNRVSGCGVSTSRLIPSFHQQSTVCGSLPAVAGVLRIVGQPFRFQSPATPQHFNLLCFLRCNFSLHIKLVYHANPVVIGIYKEGGSFFHTGCFLTHACLFPCVLSVGGLSDSGCFFVVALPPAAPLSFCALVFFSLSPVSCISPAFCVPFWQVCQFWCVILAWRNPSVGAGLRLLCLFGMVCVSFWHVLPVSFLPFLFPCGGGAVGWLVVRVCAASFLLFSCIFGMFPACYWGVRRWGAPRFPPLVSCVWSWSPARLGFFRRSRCGPVFSWFACVFSRFFSGSLVAFRGQVLWSFFCRPGSLPCLARRWSGWARLSCSSLCVRCPVVGVVLLLFSLFWFCPLLGRYFGGFCRVGFWFFSCCSFVPSSGVVVCVCAVSFVCAVWSLVLSVSLGWCSRSSVLRPLRSCVSASPPLLACCRPPLFCSLCFPSCPPPVVCSVHPRPWCLVLACSPGVVCVVCCLVCCCVPCLGLVLGLRCCCWCCCSFPVVCCVCCLPAVWWFLLGVLSWVFLLLVLVFGRSLSRMSWLRFRILRMVLPLLLSCVPRLLLFLLSCCRCVVRCLPGVLLLLMPLCVFPVARSPGCAISCVVALALVVLLVVFLLVLWCAAPGLLLFLRLVVSCRCSVRAFFASPPFVCLGVFVVLWLLFGLLSVVAFVLLSRCYSREDAPVAPDPPRFRDPRCWHSERCPCYCVPHADCELLCSGIPPGRHSLPGSSPCSVCLPPAVSPGSRSVVRPDPPRYHA